jgi:hypothetical protein
LSRTVDEDLEFLRRLLHADLSGARKTLTSGQIQVTLELNQGHLKRARVTTERIASPAPPPDRPVQSAFG